MVRSGNPDGGDGLPGAAERSPVAPAGSRRPGRPPCRDRPPEISGRAKHSALTSVQNEPIYVVIPLRVITVDLRHAAVLR